MIEWREGMGDDAWMQERCERKDEVLKRTGIFQRNGSSAAVLNQIGLSPA